MKNKPEVEQASIDYTGCKFYYDFTEEELKENASSRRILGRSRPIGKRDVGWKAMDLCSNQLSKKYPLGPKLRERIVYH